jgi:hypothetical protein
MPFGVYAAVALLVCVTSVLGVDVPASLHLPTWHCWQYVASLDLQTASLKLKFEHCTTLLRAAAAVSGHRPLHLA